MTFMKKFRGFEIIYEEDDVKKIEDNKFCRLSMHPDETYLAYSNKHYVIFADFHGNKIRNVQGIDKTFI
jgi:hypothetical protein